MAGTRTGLSATDIAEPFRDVCGDGSMEWVAGPTQMWVLLDAADMLDEFAELRKERDFYYNQVTENGERAQRAIDALNDENAKLRELVRDYERCTMHADCDKCEYDGKTSTHCPMSPCFPDSDELRELGIEVDG